MSNQTIVPGSDDARALYPITEHTVFMNHASVSPLSTRVMDAMQAWLAWIQHHGGRDDSEIPIDDYRATLARLIGATAEEIAIIPNTSEGLLRVAHGFPWQPGDKLLTVEGEFPANVYPWLPLQEQGVEIVRLPCPEHRIRPEAIEAALREDPSIRLLAISFVEFHSGFRNDLATLGNLCRDYDVKFCVDAVQGLGGFPIDVEAMQIDFLAAGSLKWLMGPMGAGIFYVRRDLIDFLQSDHHGWRSTTAPDDHFRYDAPWSESASRFETGTLPLPNLVGLVASVETLLEVGVEQIERQLHTLGEALIEGAAARGYEVITPRNRQNRAGIISLCDPDGKPEEVVARLDRAHITVSARGPFVRISPHFYNNHADIERLLATL